MSQSINKTTFFTGYVSLIVALGGFLMGFDASVISGVVKFIEPEFELSKIQLGWAVASLSLTATFAMMVSGPLSDKFGRRIILKVAALLFLLSAIGSAVAPDFISLVIARMIGGFGVGVALIIAPMYIAEIAPPRVRGRMVSLNQLNIVLGISVAFFTNYLILQLANSDAQWLQQLNIAQWNWRWMLGLEAVPAALYFGFLFLVPESPRWLIMQNRDQEALTILQQTTDKSQAEQDIKAIRLSLSGEEKSQKVPFSQLFSSSMRLVMIVGISIAILQQITGINAVFFYAPMIFEQSGFGTDASFVQAILVGLTNLLFTLIAISLIDKLGRKFLLIVGVSGIAVCMLTLASAFGSATYTLDESAIGKLPAEIEQSDLLSLKDTTFYSDIEFKQALQTSIGKDLTTRFESQLIASAIDMNQNLVLASILGFVAFFAVSLGPVMWVLFSELFPNRIRGLAISFVGLINSAVSFLVQLVFPWELANIGVATTFLMYGIFAILGLAIMIKFLPETKGKSLEELELILTSK